MTDRKGDESKRPIECGRRENGRKSCPYLKETGGGFEGERYSCEVCGETYFLDYEDMK